MPGLSKPEGPNSLLVRILLIRVLIIFFALVTHLLSSAFLDIGLKHSILWLLVIYGIASVAVSAWRVQSKASIKETEILGHLIIDAIFLTFILYYSGGAVNPFVSYYLVLLAICATALEKIHVWILVFITISGYSFLMLNSSAHYHDNQGIFAWHLWGMWLNFLAMAGIIGFFVSRMGESLRQHQMLLVRERENALRNEQIVAVGNMAAGTAHELGTPLSTIAVILTELEQDYVNSNGNDNDTQWHDDLRLLQEQVAVCKARLKTFSKMADSQFEKSQPMPVNEFIKELLDQWQIVRPEAKYSLSVEKKNSAFIIPDYTLRHALMNLLNNAVDASHAPIDIILDWDDKNIFIKIKDTGPGISKDVLDSLGRLFYSSKSGGMGLGFFLANATIERMGGRIKILTEKNTEKIAGTSIEVQLPQWAKA